MSATAATAADTITVVVSAKFKEPAVAAKTCIDQVFDLPKSKVCRQDLSQFKSFPFGDYRAE